MPPSPQIFIKSSDDGTPVVPHATTYDCTSAEEGDERLFSHRRANDQLCRPEVKPGPLETTSPVTGASSWQEMAVPLFYVSTLAILGTVLRLYVGRFFGLDCLRKEQDEVESTDFLFPLSSLICITSDGRTERGGALFIDLPANMLGSFCMGLLSPRRDPTSVPQHQVSPLHLGLKVGFCGCLTTFSSWNTQMVVMMDGTDTIYDPQVAAALFGYVIGMIGALSCFIAGTHATACFPTTSGCTAPERRSHDVSQSSSPLMSRTAMILLCTCTALVALLMLGDFYWHAAGYREFWMAALWSPLGAVLRYRLLPWNAHNEKFPWGTWSANVLAALVCSLVTALSSTVVGVDASWAVPALQALGTGLAGSLSTVSSLVQELVGMEPVGRAYLYALATIVPTMFMSLLIYVPIVRFW